MTAPRRPGPPKVLIDGSPLADGRGQAGIGRYVASMIRALQDREDVAVSVAIPGRKPLAESWEMRWLNGQASVLTSAVRRRPLLLHGMASEAALAWPAQRQVVTVHDVIPWSRPGRRRGATAAYLAFQRRRLRRCGAIITDSAVVAAEATDLLRLDPQRVHVVPAGVDGAFTTTIGDDEQVLRERAGAPPGGYVMWVGSLRFHDPRKALDVLLQAMTHHPRVPLVLVGAPGAESERVRLHAQEVGLDARLPGFVSDATLAALYRGAAAVAIPSQHEGFGLPMVEAMASGAPVVAARAGNLPSIAGDAATLVPPNDPVALAEAIKIVLADKAVADRLRAAGPAVAAAYTWQNAAELTVGIYTALAERGG